MRTLIVIAVIAILALGSYYLMISSQKWAEILPLQEVAVKPKDSWVDYTSPNNQFSVLLPFMPQTAEETVKAPGTDEVRHYHMFVSEKPDGTLFVITLITFPDKSVKIEGKELLKIAMQDLIASNPQNAVINKEEGTFEGYPSLNYVIQNSETTMEVNSFLDKNTLVILSRTAKIENTDANEFQFFINSFELKGALK